MGGIVDAGEVLEIQMGIGLGRADISMAEELLDGTQVTA